MTNAQPFIDDHPTGTACKSKSFSGIFFNYFRLNIFQVTITLTDLPEKTPLTSPGLKFLSHKAERSKLKVCRLPGDCNLPVPALGPFPETSRFSDRSLPQLFTPRFSLFTFLPLLRSIITITAMRAAQAVPIMVALMPAYWARLP